MGISHTVHWLGSSILQSHAPIEGHWWRYSRALIDVDIGSMFNRDINLAIAGDWLHGSRIGGAYLSGLELAESILKMK